MNKTLEDILPLDCIENCEYRHGSETAERVNKVYQSIKNKPIEDLTIKEIKAVAPLIVNQTIYYDWSEDVWISETVKSLIIKSK